MPLKLQLNGMQIARNPSWAASARTGLGLCAWLPTSLLHTLRLPLYAIVVGFISLVASIALWLVVNPVMIVLGLMGFVVRLEDDRK